MHSVSLYVQYVGVMHLCIAYNVFYVSGMIVIRFETVSVLIFMMSFYLFARVLLMHTVCMSPVLRFLVGENVRGKTM